jgi:hypothetical protein
LESHAAGPDDRASSHDFATDSMLTLDGDTALWTVAIRPDQTSDFEKFVAKLRHALRESPDPQRRQQAEGWQIVQGKKPLYESNITYIYIVHPVVLAADYTFMLALYEQYSDERERDE